MNANESGDWVSSSDNQEPLGIGALKIENEMIKKDSENLKLEIKNLKKTLAEQKQKENLWAEKAVKNETEKKSARKSITGLEQDVARLKGEVEKTRRDHEKTIEALKEENAIKIRKYEIMYEKLSNDYKKQGNLLDQFKNEVGNLKNGISVIQSKEAENIAAIKKGYEEKLKRLEEEQSESLLMMRSDLNAARIEEARLLKELEGVDLLKKEIKSLQEREPSKNREKELLNSLKDKDQEISSLQTKLDDVDKKLRDVKENTKIMHENGVDFLQAMKEKDEEIKRLEAKIKEDELSNNNSRAAQLEKSLNEKNEELRKLEEKLHEVSKKEDENDNQKQTMSKEKEETLRQLEEKLNNNSEKYEAALREKDENLKRLERQLEEMNKKDDSNNSGLDNAIVRHENEVANLRQEMDLLKENNKSLRKQLEELGNITDRRDRLNEEPSLLNLENLEPELKKSIMEMQRKYKDRINDLENQLAKHGSDVKDEIAKYQNEIKNLKDKIKEMESANEKAMDDIKRLKKEQIAEMENIASELKNRYEAELSNLMDQVKVLESVNKETRQRLGGSRKEGDIETEYRDMQNQMKGNYEQLRDTENKLRKEVEAKSQEVGVLDLAVSGNDDTQTALSGQDQGPIDRGDGFVNVQQATMKLAHDGIKSLSFNERVQLHEVVRDSLADYLEKKPIDFPLQPAIRPAEITLAPDVKKQFLLKRIKEAEDKLKIRQMENNNHVQDIGRKIQLTKKRADALSTRARRQVAT